MAAGLMTLVFRKNRAKVRYGLWLSASLKFFMPFALLTSLGSHFRPAPEVSLTIQRIIVPFLDDSLSWPARVVMPPPRTVDWASVGIGAVWLCGFLTVAFLRLRCWLGIRAAVRASTLLPISSEVEIRSAPGMLEPGVVGWVRPILLLPTGIGDCLTEPQLEAVIAHELCHVRRRDNMFASIHMIVEAVYWFHPLVWWIGARLVEERERACDEGVLTLGNEPRIYADAILNVCKLYVESPLVCVSGVTGANLKRRIEAIMTNNIGTKLNGAKKLLLACAGAAALAAPVAIGVMGVTSVPLIRAQSPPVVVPTAAPVISPMEQLVATPTARKAGSEQAATPEGHLIAMLFDLASMTPDQQSAARMSAINFIQSKVEPADRVAVMSGMNGKVSVLQDFTSDQVVLVAAVQKLVAGETGAASGLSYVESAANLLAAVPEKKRLLYYSGGYPPGAEEEGDPSSPAVECGHLPRGRSRVGSAGVFPNSSGRG